MYDYKLELFKKYEVRIWQLLLFAGVFLFILLYIIASYFYPGGTHLDKTSEGFSWSQNYWCNLLSEKGLNGRVNPARPIAFIAMIILCITLILFWYYFPIQHGFSKWKRYIMQASGLLSMIVTAFIFTPFHDMVIILAGMFGLIALTGNLIGLKQSGLITLFWMEIGLLLLIGLNNLMYYQKNMMFYLPVVQKITFLYFLIWIVLINLKWLQTKARTWIC